MAGRGISRRRFLKKTGGTLAASTLAGGFVIRCGGTAESPDADAGDGAAMADAADMADGADAGGLPDGRFFRDLHLDLSHSHADWEHFLVVGGDAHVCERHDDASRAAAREANALLHEVDDDRLTHKVDGAHFPIAEAQTYTIVARPAGDVAAVPVLAACGVHLPEAAVVAAHALLGDAFHLHKAADAWYELGIDWGQGEGKADSPIPPLTEEGAVALLHKSVSELGTSPLEQARWALMHHPSVLTADPVKLAIVLSHIDAVLLRDVNRARAVGGVLPATGTVGASLLLLITKLGPAVGLGVDGQTEQGGVGWAHAYFVQDVAGDKVQRTVVDPETEEVSGAVLDNGQPDYLYHYVWNTLFQRGIAPLFTELIARCQADPLLANDVAPDSAGIGDGGPNGRSMIGTGTAGSGMRVGPAGYLRPGGPADGGSAEGKADGHTSGIIPDITKTDYEIAPDISLATDGDWKHNTRVSMCPIFGEVAANAMAVTLDNTGFRHLGLWCAFQDATGAIMDLSAVEWRDTDGTIITGLTGANRTKFADSYSGTKVLTGNGTWQQTNDREVDWDEDSANCYGSDTFDSSKAMYLGLQGPPPSLLGLPIVSTSCSSETAKSGNCIISASYNYIMPSATNAAKVLIIVTSPGHGSNLGSLWTDPDAFADSSLGDNAWTMTALFEYTVPTMLLAMGALFANSEALKGFADKTGLKIASAFTTKFPNLAVKTVPVASKPVAELVAKAADSGVKAVPGLVGTIAKKGVNYGSNKASGTQGGVSTLTSIGFTVLDIALKQGLAFILSQASAAAAANAIPIVGTASMAINAAAWGAQILWTTTDVLMSDQAYAHYAARTYTLRVRLFPDRGDASGGRLPSPSFPQVLLHGQPSKNMGPGVVYVRLSGNGIQTRDMTGSRGEVGLWVKDGDFKYGTETILYELDGESYPQDVVTLTFPGIPRGTHVTFVCSLQTADGWVTGQAKQEVVVADPGDTTPAWNPVFDVPTETLTIDVPITQCLIPVTTDTRYNHMGRTFADSLKLSYLDSDSPPLVTPGSPGAYAGTPRFITLNRPTAQTGFGWRGVNTALSACGTDTGGGVYNQVRSTALPPTGASSGVSQLTCGLPVDVHLTYQTEGPPSAGYHFVVYKIDAEHPSTGLPYYEVRKLDLGVHLAGDPCDPAKVNCSQLDDFSLLPLWGMFWSSSIRKVVSHPSGFLVALHDNGVKMEVLDLAPMIANPGRAEATVPRGTFISGPACPQVGVDLETMTSVGGAVVLGKLCNAVAIAPTPTGKTFLALDAGAGVIQAFDNHGMAVTDYFTVDPGGAGASTTRSALLTLATHTGTVTYLDLAAEWNGLVYVLLHTGAGTGANDYILEIYDRKTSQLLVQQAGIAAASLVVDFWRTVYTLGFEKIELDTGPEPTVSIWGPSTPDCEADPSAAGCAVDESGQPTGNPNPVGGC